MHNHFLERIKTVFPQPIKTVKVIDHGWSNLVFEVNGEWMFRFLQSDLGAKQLLVEQAFLPLLQPISPIVVPTIEYFGDDFIGYKKINGVPFSRKKIESLSHEQRKIVTNQLGAFLSVLHSMTFTHPNLVENPYGVSDFWAEAWAPVEPLLNERLCEKARTWFTESIQKVAAVPFKKTVTHCDLGTHNILFDESTHTIAGVIDFGDIALFDPARDFNGFLRNFGAEFTAEVLKNYTLTQESNFYDRIEYYAKRQPFFIIAYAKKFGHEEVIPQCILDIQTSFI